MFFGCAFGSFGFQLFATHPPLVDRVQRIDQRLRPCRVARDPQSASALVELQHGKAQLVPRHDPVTRPEA